MPFLPPNQKRHSTEGTIIITGIFFVNLLAALKNKKTFGK